MLALLLPYVELPDLHPFGLTIHPFGIFAALGVYLGAVLTVRAGRVYGPGDTKSLAEVFTWALVGGLLGAHLLHVLGYHPELLRTQGPLVLLKIWDGVSSMGGVLGGMAGIALYFRRKRLSIYPYWDALALGTAPGWAVARMGCAVVHDHPGVRSHAWFAVAFPEGPRLDMGLVDCVLLLILSALLFAIGFFGVLFRRNTLVIFMCLELMLVAATLALVAFSRFNGTMDGNVFVFFILTVAAAEVAVGLAIIVALFRKRQTIEVDQLNALKN